MRLKVPTKIGPCYPRCTPTYGTGGRGSRSHRLVSGLLPGEVAVNPWWDPAGEGLCIWAAYQPKGAASLAASYTDLSGNGNNTGPGTAPTWDAVNGWKFQDASAQYLITTFVPANDQSQTMLVQFTSATSLNDYLAGSWELATGDKFVVRPRVGGDAFNSAMNGNGEVFTLPKITAGNLGVAGSQGYVDGGAQGGALGAWTGASASAVWIGCANRSGAGNGHVSAYIQALALYDCVLTAPQVAAVRVRMAAL